MALSILGFTVSWKLLGTLAAILVGRHLWQLTYFRRNGIKGPTPAPLVGNISSMVKDGHWKMMEYIKKYGKVFGLYFFSSPLIFVSDLDMIKDITIKSFSKFMNHKQFVLKSRPFDKSLLNLRDQRWKDVRNIVTPTFSAVKMRQLSTLVNECCDLLVKNFGECQEKEDKVKVFSHFEAFTMDGIAKCAFGLQVDSQHNPNDPFVVNGRRLVKGKLNAKIMIAGMFPLIGQVMDYFHVSAMSDDLQGFFIKVISEAMEIRKQSGDSQRKDFLQLIMNAEKEIDNKEEKMAKEENDIHSLVDDQSNASYFDAKKSKKTTLTTDEIYGQAVIFFIGGFETTSSTLGFLVYSLATNPDVQDKLIAEIDDKSPTRDLVSYNSIANMPYLDNVVCETLRLYPPGTALERECNEDYTYGDITIPKGFQIVIPAFAIQRDPEHWPNPEQFDPDRFTKKNREGRHPFAWMPFGNGPRNCIGMRFAQMEIKMAVVRLLQKYRFETLPETVVPVQFGPEKLKPDDDILLRVVERS